MSYHTWSVDGYGICTSEIVTTIERIEELLKHAPIFSKKLHDDFLEWEIDEPNIYDYLGYDCDYYTGIAFIMKEVIKEAEDIQLDTAENFDGDWYLLLCPWYPWTPVTEREKNLTIEELDCVFKKYIHIVTDDELIIKYQSVENGG